jgi:hypothetical protein
VLTSRHAKLKVLAKQSADLYPCPDLAKGLHLGKLEPSDSAQVESD